MTENQTQPLLLFDEILKKGFDGQNFINGLSTHLRNLMVARDERTTTLMDIPDKTRNQYIDQAKRVPYSKLLTWLNIGAQCDIHYKASKNQRLLVELALMKMANVGNVLKQPVSAEPTPDSAKKKVN